MTVTAEKAGTTATGVTATTVTAEAGTSARERPSSPRPAKRTPYFGTYLGNSGAGKKEEDTNKEEE